MSTVCLRCSDLQCLCGQKIVSVQGRNTIPAASRSAVFCSPSVGGVGVARSKTILLVDFLSWSTFGLSEGVTWGVGNGARERGQTSIRPHTHAHTHTFTCSCSSAFLPLESFFFHPLTRHRNKNSISFWIRKQKNGEFQALQKVYISMNVCNIWFNFPPVFFSFFSGIFWQRVRWDLFLSWWWAWPADCQPLLLHMKRLPEPVSDERRESDGILQVSYFGHVCTLASCCAKCAGFLHECQRLHF